jgi:hypothetical protein
LASGAVTTFKTGPFTVSVDLGMSCNDTNISKPVKTDELSGLSYTTFPVRMCGVAVDLIKYESKNTFDLTKPFGTLTQTHLLQSPRSMTGTLVQLGVEENTYKYYIREINSEQGVVGFGYIPKYNSTFYVAGFYVSPKSECWIYLKDNQTEMTSALKTIHVKEA